MAFTSYAQNFEDIMLWRALSHIPHGFYVDIGAQDPVSDSVSRGFYEHGWRGVHVEPIPYWANRLRENRPDEIVLEIAVGPRSGTMDFYCFPDSGLSTGRLDYAEIFEKDHHFSCETIHVSCRTFHDTIDTVLQGREIHWLKIDAEGMEKEILSSWNQTSSVRPWIIVVEAMHPLTETPSFSEWESILIVRGYDLIYFDGLNRFYLSREHHELSSAFSSPPNIFDVGRGVVLYRHHPWLQRVDWLAEAQATQANERANYAEAQATQANERANAARQQLEDVLNSRSWKITKPLRLASNFVQWFVRGSKAWLTFSPGSRPRRILRRFLIIAKQYVSSKPRIKKIMVRIISLSPKLKARLKMVGNGYSLPPERIISRRARAQNIFNILKETIKRNNGKHRL